MVNQQTPIPKPKATAPINKSIILYSIIKDLKDQKANITFGQLLAIALSVRSELNKGLRRTKEETSAFNNQLSSRTTALCCSAMVNGIPITLIIDSGASGSIISKSFIDDHGITIERPSNVTMTNINGERRVPLGAIDNFPISVGTITAPIKVDVTEAKTYSVIAGNDWLMQVKATIDYASANLTIRDNDKTIHIPCTYVQDNPGLVKPPIQSLPQEQQASSHQVPLEQEFDDESEDEDDGEYLFNETETTAIQERSI